MSDSRTVDDRRAARHRAPSITALLRSLTFADAGARSGGHTALTALGVSTAALAEALVKDPDPRVRHGASIRLGIQGIDDDRSLAVEALRSAVNDPNWHVCRSVLRTLGSVHAVESLADCVAALDDPQPQVVSAAVEAVADLGGAGAGVHLIPILAHEAQRVQFDALRADERLGCREAAPEVIRLLESSCGRVRSTRLDYDVPKLAIRLLGEWRSTGAVAVLIRVVNEELGLRSVALDALLRIRSGDAAAALVPLLGAAYGDRHADDLALGLLDLMARTDHRASSSEVRRYLGHPNRALRTRAVEILAQWRDAESADQLRNLSRHNGSEFVRPAAARALALILGPAAVPDLVHLADEISPAMRAVVVESLAAIDPLPEEGAEVLRRLSSYPQAAAAAQLAVSPGIVP